MNNASRRSRRNGVVVNRLATTNGFGFTSRRTKKIDNGINWKKWVDQTSEIAAGIYSTEETNSPELLLKWWEN